MAKTKIFYSMICLVILSLFAGQALAAEWKFFASSGSGEMFYDKNSIKKEKKNIARVWIKKIYSERGKLEKFSWLQKTYKAPRNPYILSHELTLLDIDCVNKKIKISSGKICDKRGQIVVSTPQPRSEWNPILRKSSDEELKNIICPAIQAQNK